MAARGRRRGSSSASTGPTPRAPRAGRAAAGSGWRSSPRWWPRTAARSTLDTAPGEGAVFAVRLPRSGPPESADRPVRGLRPAGVTALSPIRGVTRPTTARPRPRADGRGHRAGRRPARAGRRLGAHHACRRRSWPRPRPTGPGSSPPGSAAPDPAGAQLPGAGRPVAFRRVFNPVTGVGSALAPPLRSVRRPRATAAWSRRRPSGSPYEGPPGYAARRDERACCMDQLLGRAADRRRPVGHDRPPGAGLPRPGAAGDAAGAARPGAPRAPAARRSITGTIALGGRARTRVLRRGARALRHAARRSSSAAYFGDDHRRRRAGTAPPRRATATPPRSRAGPTGGRRRRVGRRGGRSGAADVLLALRARGAADRRALGDAGDAAAQQAIAAAARRRTGPATPSSARRPPTTARRLAADRVWIVDPLDGTREYGEPATGTTGRCTWRCGSAGGGLRPRRPSRCRRWREVLAHRPGAGRAAACRPGRCASR